MSRQEVRLAIVGADAAIQRRPLGLDAGLLRPAEDVAVLPANTRAGAFFRAVADAGGDLPVLSLRHRDADGHFLVHQHRLFERLDVRELEQLEPVQLALAFAHLTPRIAIARLERQLTTDDVLADRCLAADVDFAEVRQHARHRVDNQTTPVGRGLFVAQRDLRIGIAIVAKRVERAFA